MEISGELLEKLKQFQKTEITEAMVYRALASSAKGQNRKVLEKIAAEEIGHYERWKNYTGQEVKPNKILVFLYKLISFIFGLTFSIKLMEGGEKEAQEKYSVLLGKIPEAEEIIQEEVEHERELIEMIDEERINYIGSMVLGLNDAIVELTGALAGLTFAIQNVRIIGLAGMITGIAAALSMGASEYLSQKAEGSQNPLKAAIYTAIAYIFAVFLLVVPYFLFSSYLIALAVTLLGALLIILLFTFFVSVVREQKFSSLFGEMVGISFGVAFVSFLIGLAARHFLKIEI